MALGCPPNVCVAEVMLMLARNNNLDRATSNEQTRLELEVVELQSHTSLDIVVARIYHTYETPSTDYATVVACDAVSKYCMLSLNRPLH
jgi:uncharacterized membrane protein YgcG